jgi:hypothetical protein
MADHSIGLRVQEMPIEDQGVVLATIAEARAQSGYFAPKDLDDLFTSAGLPGPSRVANLLSTLVRLGYVRAGRAKGEWKVTPKGRHHSTELLSDFDIASLAAEAAASHGSILGGTVHSVVPPSLAPPGLLNGLKKFLAAHPFETNVFAMTRFPSSEPTDSDPVGPAIKVARHVCKLHGLELHLASDRAIQDDLWANVTAHMWASRYGLAFFEDRMKKGLNYNLTIEVGGMLTTGRRCALLKDPSVTAMPTDLVGQIYKPVDLSDAAAVGEIVHKWVRDDLDLGPCSSCPKA